MVGIIGVDPGLTTGLAWGIFNPGLRDRTSNWLALARGRDIGSMQIGPRDPYKDKSPNDAHEASLMVTKAVVDRIVEWNTFRGMGRGEIIVACEHFEVRGVAMGASSQTGLAPVFIGGVLFGTLVGMGWGENLEWVRAGEHKPYATDPRIKRLGKFTNGRIGWVRGKPHTRDAWRIVAYKLNKVA